MRTESKRTLTLKKRTLSNSKDIWYFIDGICIKEVGSEELCRYSYNKAVSDIKSIANAPYIVKDEIIEQYTF
jgi:hypothetical protein